MTPDIDSARILKHLLDDRRVELAPGPCPVCHDRGITQVDACVRYCMCRTGREKKREWLALPAVERAPYELAVPTLPDAEDLAVRTQPKNNARTA